MTFAEPVLTSPYPIDPMPGWVVELRASAAPVWIFAYGSLMWNPEMRFAERMPARIHGYHRAFCLYSPEYRGTREKPGLVLGLDRGGSCRGIAYRLPEATLAAEIDLIWTREMTGFVYHMTPLKIATARGAVRGYAFTVRRDFARLCRPPRVGRRRTDHRHFAGRSRHRPRLPRQHGAPFGRARHRRYRAPPHRTAGQRDRVKPIELGYGEGCTSS